MKESEIEVGGMKVEIRRKAIQNIHLTVHPPHGRVTISAPEGTSDEVLRQMLVVRMPWIRRKQQSYLEQARQPVRQYLSGETHYFRGKAYQLRVHEERTVPRLEIKNGRWLHLYVRPGAEHADRERIVETFYRRHLKEVLPGLLEKWAPILSVDIPDFGVKKMRTKWGSCKVSAPRIWLNLDLAKVAPRLLEYVVVHELAHLRVPNHGEAFQSLLDRHMRDWRERKQSLNALIFD